MNRSGEKPPPMEIHSTGAGKIYERMERKAKEFLPLLSQEPPFPRLMNVELSNVCNHSCTFCAYSVMERTKGNIDVENLERWLAEAYELGVREVGLHSGAEPFASPHLEHFTAYCKQLGFEYVYISTNASLATPERMKKVIDAGMDSIKFSINAGDRETYRQIHGQDHFDRVIAHLKFASEYRGERKKPYMAISFVETTENIRTLERLKELTAGFVDEYLSFKPTNQNGQMSGVGDGPPKQARLDVCTVPFNKIHISMEGFLRLCCNDYENLLALEDLNKVSLKEAVYSERFKQARRRHLDDDLEGMLCHNCKHNCQDPVQPLNPELYFATHKTDAGPPVSHSPKIFKKIEFEPAATGAKRPAA